MSESIQELPRSPLDLSQGSAAVSTFPSAQGAQRVPSSLESALPAGPEYLSQPAAKALVSTGGNGDKYGALTHSSVYRLYTAIAGNKRLLTGIMTVANVGLCMWGIERLNRESDFFCPESLVKLTESAVFIPFVANVLEPQVRNAKSTPRAIGRMIGWNFLWGSFAYAAYRAVGASQPFLSGYGFAALGSVTTGLWAAGIRREESLLEQLVAAGKTVTSASVAVGQQVAEHGARTAGFLYGSGMLVGAYLMDSVLSGYRKADHGVRRLLSDRPDLSDYLRD